MVIVLWGIKKTWLKIVRGQSIVVLEGQERIWETFRALELIDWSVVTLESCLVLSGWGLSPLILWWRKIFIEVSTFLTSSRQLPAWKSVLHDTFTFDQAYSSDCIWVLTSISALFNWIHKVSRVQCDLKCLLIVGWSSSYLLLLLCLIIFVIPFSHCVLLDLNPFSATEWLKSFNI